MFGVILSHVMKKKLVVVRKATDNDNHSAFTVENLADGDKLIFIDDLISSGETFRHCANALKFKADKDSYKPKKSEIVGGFLFASRGYHDKQYLYERTKAKP